MSDSRTGHRTSVSQRRHSTGQRDVGMGTSFDSAGPPRKQKRNAHSESSAGRADHSEVSGSDWDHDRQSMGNEPSFHSAEVKHESWRNAFGVRDRSSRELDTSHAGSWCKKK